MNSPVHQREYRYAALTDAPPWAREARAPATSPDGDDDDEPQFVGDRAMLALRRQLALEPELVPEPPVAINHRPTLDRIAWRLCAASTIAALVVWVISSLPIEPHADKVVQPALTPAPAARPVKLVHIRGSITLPQVPAAMPAPPVAAAPRGAVDTPRTIQPWLAPAPPNPVPSAAQNTLTLDPDEVVSLVKRGKDLLTNGDVSSARLLLRRAAEAGSAEAALALGSTFDPVVITRLGVIGVQADTAKARKWYERAAALGSNLASEQLANLARAGR